MVRSLRSLVALPFLFVGCIVLMLGLVVVWVTLVFESWSRKDGDKEFELFIDAVMNDKPSRTNPWS